jgi:phage tail sheath gpL-like
MSLFKFASIQALVEAKNNPRVRATADIKNGYVFAITDKYSASGSKSHVDITVAATTTADGTIQFSVGGYMVQTTVDASTQDTAAKVATLIAGNCTAALAGYGYTVANGTADVVTITAPANSASTAEVKIDSISVGESGCTLTPAYTAGTLTASYAEATDDITTLTATEKYYVAMNIIDTPELWKQSDFKVAEGGYVNTYELNSVVGYPVEISSDLVTTTYADVAVDGSDYLVPDTSNAFKWVKADSKGNAAVAIKVLE